MKKFKLKVQAAPKRAKAEKPKKTVSVNLAKLKVQVRLTPHEAQNLRMMQEGREGYHTKPVPGYIGVFDPQEPGRRPIPSQMRGETNDRFEYRWRQHFALPHPGQVNVWEHAKSPLPEHSVYMNGEVHTFMTAAQLKERKRLKALEEAADASAEADRIAGKGRVILARGGHFKNRAKAEKPVVHFKLKAIDNQARIKRQKAIFSTAPDVKTLAEAVEVARKKGMKLRVKLEPMEESPMQVLGKHGKDYSGKLSDFKKAAKSKPIEGSKVFNVKHRPSIPSLPPPPPKLVKKFIIKRG